MPELDQAPEWTEIETRLASAPILWLATVTPENLPHLVPVWFWWDGHTAVVLSRPAAQKVANFRASSSAMASIDDSDRGHQPIVFRALAVLDPVPAIQQELSGYLTKYEPFMRAMNWASSEMLTSFSQVVRLTPSEFLQFG